MNKTKQENLIDIKELTKIYDLGKTKVYGLREVNLTIKKGQIVGIVGPSGSGKSTLLNLIGAIDRPTAGSIYSCGKQLEAMSEKELSGYRREKVGFIFQFYNLNPALSVSDNIELPMVLNRVNKEERQNRIAELVEILNMTALKDRNVSYLSGGERQRVAIAVALANNPTIILADEPTGELDSDNAQDILSLFQQLNQKLSTTIIIISHDPKTVSIANVIYELIDGRIVKA